MTGKPSPLLSSFKLSYYTLLNLMRRMENTGQNMEYVIQHSFQQYQFERTLPEKQVHLDRLTWLFCLALSSAVMLACVLGKAWEQQLCLLHQHHCKYGSLRADCHVQIKFEHAAVVVMLSASSASRTGAHLHKVLLTCLLGLAYILCGIVLARQRELQMILHCGKVCIDRVRRIVKLCRLLVSCTQLLCLPCFCSARSPG